MICNNSNISDSNNQAFLQYCLNILYHMGIDIGGNFVPEQLPVRFTRERKSLLEFIFKRIAMFEGGDTSKRAFPSHETMQEETGLSRSAIIRALKVFEDLKLIEVDHRNLMHMSNIYSLGSVLRNATVVRLLSNTFKVIVPAFCRTMERLGNLIFARKPKEVYTGYFKSNATLSLRDVFVCSNTNTNTSLLIDNSSKIEQKFSKKSKKGEVVYEKHDKFKESKEEKDPGYMQRMNKVAIADTKSQMSMSDQVTECMKETYLPKRIELLKEVYHKVHRASQPYINFLIKKYTQKMLSEESW